ncbi:PepSY domain-containing protein [Actinomadura sp. NPDC000929]|uniref:PepSY domain-containing protein n=1 Tax=Actinomadura sp. NPDC000929 TaxID=3154517 RepID=UPI003396193A
MRFDARRMVAGRGLLVAVVAAGALAAGGATAAIAAADGGEGDSPSGEKPARTAVSLAQAADAALKTVPGKVREIELEVEDGATVWEVEVLTGDGAARKVVVDSGSGKVAADRPEKGDDDKGEATALSGAKTSVADAAAAALKAVPGHATSAGFDRDGGRAVWEVDVTGSDGSEHEVTVDDATGKAAAQKGDDDD